MIEYTELTLTCDDAEGEWSLEAELTYYIEPATPRYADSPAWPAEAHITGIRFRRCGRPAYGYSPAKEPGEWFTCQPLAHMIDTLALQDRLAKQYEAA